MRGTACRPISSPSKQKLIYRTVQRASSRLNLLCHRHLTSSQQIPAGEKWAFLLMGVEKLIRNFRSIAQAISDQSLDFSTSAIGCEPRKRTVTLPIRASNQYLFTCSDAIYNVTELIVRNNQAIHDRRTVHAAEIFFLGLQQFFGRQFQGLIHRTHPKKLENLLCILPTAFKRPIGRPFKKGALADDTLKQSI